MRKFEFNKYNDGVVFLYREKERRNDFSAKINVEVLKNMDFIAKLDYQEMSKRERDLEFAQQNDFTLNMKIKTRFFKAVDNHCKAVIDGYLYDISYVDQNRTDTFLYLEGVKRIDSRRHQGETARN